MGNKKSVPILTVATQGDSKPDKAEKPGVNLLRVRSVDGSCDTEDPHRDGGTDPFRTEGSRSPSPTRQPSVHWDIDGDPFLPPTRAADSDSEEGTRLHFPNGLGGAVHSQHPKQRLVAHEPTQRLASNQINQKRISFQYNDSMAVDQPNQSNSKKSSQKNTKQKHIFDKQSHNPVGLVRTPLTRTTPLTNLPILPKNPTPYEPFPRSAQTSPSSVRVPNFHSSALGELEDSSEQEEQDLSVGSPSESGDSIEDFFDDSLLGSPRQRLNASDATFSRLWQAPSGAFVPVVEVRDESAFPVIGESSNSFITEYSFAEDVAQVEVMELPEGVQLCVRGTSAAIHKEQPAKQNMVETQTLPSPPRPRRPLPTLVVAPKKLEKLDLKAEKRKFRRNSLTPSESSLSILSLGGESTSGFMSDGSQSTLKKKSVMRKRLENNGRKSGVVRPTRRPMSLHATASRSEVEGEGMKRARSWPLLISKDQTTQTEPSMRSTCSQSIVRLYRRVFRKKPSRVTPRGWEDKKEQPPKPRHGWMDTDDDHTGASMETLNSEH